MSVGRADTVILLRDECPVEDAEALLQQVQDGADSVDWGGCTHLHTACLQVVLASGLPLRGTPAHPGLAGWIAPLLPRAAATPAVSQGA